MCTKTEITACSKDQDSGGSQDAPEDKASTSSEIPAVDGFPGPISSTANLCDASEVSFGGISPSSQETDPNGVISFEKILEDLGCFGPFQALTLFSYLFMEISVAFVAFIPICIDKSATAFLNCPEDDPHYRELLSMNATDNYTFPTNIKVNDTNGSHGFSNKSFMQSFLHVFESPFEYESIVDEWDLKCDRAWIPDVFTSCLMAGMIVGNVFYSQMADWYGRRRAYLFILVTQFIGTFLSAISPTIYFYAVTRFVTGAGYSGFINVSCMAVMEFMTPKWRSLANMAGPMGEGFILLAVMGYFIRPWRMLYLASLWPYLLMIPIFFVLPESPRWLLRNKKVTEAHRILGYMAKINGRKPVSMEILEALRKQEELSSQTKNKKHISYMTFLKTRPLLTKTLFLFAIWFSWNVAYYGITYNIRNVPGNTYFNLGFIGIANAMGQRSSMPISDKFGRRKAVLFGFTLSASFFVALAICFLSMETVSSTLILISCFVGLYGMACTRASVRLLSGESFPTAVRTMGLGLGGLGANVAGVVTPQVAYLGSMWPAVPFFIFAGISVFGSLVVFKMKETTGNPLSDNIVQKKKKIAADGDVVMNT